MTAIPKNIYIYTIALLNTSMTRNRGNPIDFKTLYFEVMNSISYEKVSFSIAISIFILNQRRLEDSYKNDVNLKLLSGSPIF